MKSKWIVEVRKKHPGKLWRTLPSWMDVSIFHLNHKLNTKHPDKHTHFISTLVNIKKRSFSFFS